MKLIYICCCFLFFAVGTLQANIFQGYIVTKNGVRLTGQIGQLNQSETESAVIFINDFGNIYSLQPQLIKGFVFVQDSAITVFESKIYPEERRWVFMQVICKGQGLNLYKNMLEFSSKGVFDAEGIDTRVQKTNDFYLELNGKNRLPFKVRRFGFRKQLRNFLRYRAPKLSKKIGSKGYRYRDLVRIINEYNEIAKKSRRLL